MRTIRKVQFVAAAIIVVFGLTLMPAGGGALLIAGIGLALAAWAEWSRRGETGTP